MEVDVVDALNAAEKALFEYFGIKPEWTLPPIIDQREYYWRVVDNCIWYADTKEELEEETGSCFCDEIVRNEVYRKEKYTAILSDTNCDYNIWYAIFDNSKEVPLNK